METPVYSIVIPIKDEAENIQLLVSEIEEVMQSLEVAWELIYVDDGSTDESFSILKELAAQKRFLQVIQFKANYGQSAALLAGFQSAQGSYIITLDGDRQNTPEDIPKLLTHVSEADLICGIRMQREDSYFRKFIAKIANKVRGRLCHDYVADTGCSLKVYRKECLEKIKMYQGMHRFFPALFLIEGFRIKEVPVSHRERTKGTSKYSIFNRCIRPVVDMLVVCWMRRRHLKFQIQQRININGK